MITQKDLKSRLHYDTESGIFTWIKSKRRGWVGKVAGTRCKNGYEQISIDNKRYYSHRLAWLFVNGSWPKNEIDHIDRNPLNNSVKNLREASRGCNQRNVGMSKYNNTGVTGVCFDNGRKQYRAYMQIDKKHKNLGYFDNFEDAIKARVEAETKNNFYNFHEDCIDESRNMS